MSMIAEQLVQLSKQFKTSDPNQAADIRKAFKRKSLNDCTRTIVYLLEVVGSRQQEFERVKQENKDLHELLKVHGIELDKPEAVPTPSPMQEATGDKASDIAITGLSTP